MAWACRIAAAATLFVLRCKTKHVSLLCTLYQREKKANKPSPWFRRASVLTGIWSIHCEKMSQGNQSPAIIRWTQAHLSVHPQRRQGIEHWLPLEVQQHPTCTCTHAKELHVTIDPFVWYNKINLLGQTYLSGSSFHKTKSTRCISDLVLNQPNILQKHLRYLSNTTAHLKQQWHKTMHKKPLRIKWFTWSRISSKQWLQMNSFAEVFNLFGVQYWQIHY